MSGMNHLMGLFHTCRMRLVMTFLCYSFLTNGELIRPQIYGPEKIGERNEATLFCSSPTNNSSVSKYQWFVNRSDTLPSHFVPCGPQLSIINVRKTDAYQSISCRYVHNEEASEISEEFRLNVQYGPSEVIISPSDINHVKYEGAIFGPISCTADCNPPCLIQWKFNASRGNGRIEVIYTQTNVNNVSVARVNRNDTGVYRCLALANVKGSSKSARADIQLEVWYGPDPPVVRINGREIKNKQTITKRENSSIHLECSTESNPISTMKWIKDGTERRHTRSVSGNTVVFSIPNVQYEDSGSYNCSADNKFGIAKTAQIHLSVECIPRIEEPFPRIYEVGINSDINITITIRAFPKPEFSWVDLADQIQVGFLSIKQQNESTYQFQLQGTLRVTQPTDYGNYSFRIQNTVGANVYTVEISAKDSPSNESETSDNRTSKTESCDITSVLITASSLAAVLVVACIIIIILIFKLRTLQRRLEREKNQCMIHTEMTPSWLEIHGYSSLDITGEETTRPKEIRNATENAEPQEERRYEEIDSISRDQTTPKLVHGQTFKHLTQRLPHGHL